ncbi:phosphoribosyltransferase-like protein [Bilophila wadsworthia]
MPITDSINSICQTLSDYEYYHSESFVAQNGEAGIQPHHVERWLEQFDGAKREDFARAFAKVLRKSYLSKETIKDRLSVIVRKNKNYLNCCSLLDIQINGESQSRLIYDFVIPQANELSIQYSVNDNLKKCFLYIDDVVFSGGRVSEDIIEWINKFAPMSCNIVLYFVCSYSYGVYNINKRLNEAIKASGKKIEYKIVCEDYRKNNRIVRDVTDILHPREVPPEAASFYEEINNAPRYPILRTYQQSGPSPFFESEAERALLEEQFVIAGIRILSQLTNRGNWKPLGLEGFPSFGFGSTIVTYRNCPNISPLALWWGEQSDSSIWYPLVPRKGYNKPENPFAGLFDEEV